MQTWKEELALRKRFRRAAWREGLIKRRSADWNRKAFDPRPGDGLRFFLWLALVAGLALAALLGP